MEESTVNWYSNALGLDVKMLVFGTKGLPIILFPTSMGKHNENRDFKLIESAAWFIDNGFVQIFCPDGFDELSWYNKNVAPSVRVQNHVCYDRMLHEELIPEIKDKLDYAKVALAGCSFGGYHAANYGFRHPENVSHIMTMGAAFDIRDQVKGHYDDNVYFNNPIDFLKNASDPDIWKIKIILGTTEDDMCKDSTLELSQILDSKGIKHWLDIKPNGAHDWPIWREMFPHYLSAR